jgi:hypothetical protein
VETREVVVIRDAEDADTPQPAAAKTLAVQVAPSLLLHV